MHCVGHLVCDTMAALANEYTHLERNDHDQDLLIFLKNKLFQKGEKVCFYCQLWGRELGFFMLIPNAVAVLFPAPRGPMHSGHTFKHLGRSTRASATVGHSLPSPPHHHELSLHSW